ncbi:MAG: potassium channel family protein [Parvularcula sp.]|jgi:hypothetical protein|nr:potassium channel family protein [Parvularcula sp.]
MIQADGIPAQLIAAAATTAAAVSVHVLLTAVIRPVIGTRSREPGVLDDVFGFVRVLIVSMFLVFAHGASVTVWALSYLLLGVSEDFEAALYFALSTYTTLGFGDVLAPESWRLLTGFAALNGLLLFGLSAAILVNAARHLMPAHRGVNRH